jgi:hypothetical protein
MYIVYVYIWACVWAEGRRLWYVRHSYFLYEFYTHKPIRIRSSLSSVPYHPRSCVCVCVYMHCLKTGHLSWCVCLHMYIGVSPSVTSCRVRSECIYAYTHIGLPFFNLTLDLSACWLCVLYAGTSGSILRRIVRTDLIRERQSSFSRAVLRYCNIHRWLAMCVLFCLHTKAKKCGGPHLSKIDGFFLFWRICVCIYIYIYIYIYIHTNLNAMHYASLLFVVNACMYVWYRCSMCIMTESRTRFCW